MLKQTKDRHFVTSEIITQPGPLPETLTSTDARNDIDVKQCARRTDRRGTKPRNLYAINSYNRRKNERRSEA